MRACAPLCRCHQRSVLAVRRKHAVKSRQIHARLRYQGGQSCDEVERLKDHQGDRAGTGSCMAMAGFVDQVRRDNTVDDNQHPAHDLGPAGKQETQLERETQDPLAHGLLGQHLVDQQGRALGHAPCPAARAKTPTFA